MKYFKEHMKNAGNLFLDISENKVKPESKTERIMLHVTKLAIRSCDSAFIALLSVLFTSAF